jgi:hypothetical protein
MRISGEDINNLKRKIQSKVRRKAKRIYQIVIE